MSKMLDALNKVKEERQRQAGSVPRSPAASPALPPVARHNKSGLWPIGYGILAILLIVTVTGSVLVNFKTMAQLENAGAMTLVLSGQMEEQKQELAAIRKHWTRAESARKDQREQIIALQKNVKNLKQNLEKANSSLAKVEDLRVNDKLMLEKFIALNNRVRRMEEVKQ